MANSPQPSDALSVEAKKDLFDLRRELNFVATHRGFYKEMVERLLAREPHADVHNWARRIPLEDSTLASEQFSPDLARDILARMPKIVSQLSKLNTIHFKFAGYVGVPQFNDKGDFVNGSLWQGNVFEARPPHPGRVLVGMSSNLSIYPTFIPPSVCDDAELVRFYQIHVFLHELFHTIETPRRNAMLARKTGLRDSLGDMTFGDWVEGLTESIYRYRSQVAISMYAECYDNNFVLGQGKDPQDKVVYSVAENACEAFVAHQLGITPNTLGLGGYLQVGDPAREPEDRKRIAETLKHMRMLMNSEVFEYPFASKE